MKKPQIAFFALTLLAACPPTPPGPVKDACSGITMPATAGPASGTNTLCTAATDCREDTMAQLLGASFCSDKGGQCQAGAAACSSACVGVVNASGLVVTPNSCSWDRNSECQLADGTAGKKCTCAWTIPAGSSLSCGCGCK